MKKKISLIVGLISIIYSFGQSTSVTFNCGSVQTWTVPPCINEVTVTVAGAQGGTVGGATGGLGAVITSVVTVNPGDVIVMDIGCQGTCPGGGYNGGGNGFNSTNGVAAHHSCGGGGSTNTTGFFNSIAAGGGGAGGGSVNNNGGGAGGCVNGSPGGNTFGTGGGGATQVAGGNGGAPWAGTPPGGSPGVAGQGGNGGFWQTASGGGGGGGLFGGGGGGNDGCCTGANGGGGGGGGSSLVPGGAGCAGGSNAGNGYVTITTLCENIPPTASSPAPITVQCIEMVPLPDVNVITDEADNCDPNPDVAFVSDISDGNTCPETITRTYSVTDSCLNQLLVTQSIIVHDVTPPTASNIPGSTVSCIGEIPAPDPAVVTDEADNCAGPIVVAHVSDVSDGNVCPETITRTYSVTDACGNSINVTQLFTVHDLTEPTASNPAPITINCLSDLPVPNPAVVTDAADNCGAPIVTWFSDATNGNSCNNEIITRTYSVADACFNTIYVSQEIHINAFLPIIDAGPDQSVCEGVEIRLMAINPDGAGISWDQGVVDGVGFFPPVGNSVYTVTADICHGECITTDIVNVRINPLPVIQFAADSLLGCEPHETEFTNLSTEQYDCVWEFGDNQTSESCGPVTHTFDYPGTYDVTLTVTSIAGCVSTDTYEDYIEVIDLPESRFQVSNVVANFDDPFIFFRNVSSHASWYEWDFGDNTTSTTVSPTHEFPGEIERSYLVTLTAYNALGCVDSTSKLVYMEDVLIYYVPNSFTPDGDEFNDIFLPVFTEGFNIYDYHLTIFNRWGEIVFESYNAIAGWNGHYGSGELAEDGAYIWQIEFSETGVDKKHEARGHVILLK